MDFNNPNKPLLGEIYVKFYEAAAGNSLKKSRLHCVLKECVPIKIIVQRFPRKKGKTIVTVERKQFP